MRDEPIRTERAFHEALVELLEAAEEYGVDVAGGWAVGGNGTGSAWDVEIIELATGPDES